MKKLLVPVDFSETSEAAIEFAIELADKCGYHITLHHSVDLVHSYEGMYMDVPHMQSFTKQLIDDMEVKLENLLRKYRRDRLVIQKHLTIGTLFSDIQTIVQEQDIDLIVMGTKGASGLKEFFVGSNTEKVVRMIDIPIISVPGKTEVKRIRKILVPIDLNEIRASFLFQISFFQQLFSAAVEFIWVQTPHDIENEELVMEEMNTLLSDYEIASSSFTIIKSIFPQDGILNYAKESEADMLAMSTHARRGLAHWFAGSLTEDVLNHLKVPMWTLKMDMNDPVIHLENYQRLKEEESY